ncbi:MAG: acyl-ACP--UDP-N-acetylglucosamine O-acyltransferase [Candidatus Avelusimicrobium sp.]|uniref:acyl-ACP--UDP-N-acetylglucosamine O-acyltransferase n=1 Tax=Candidatus Avelusimicrobium sp. TaxID=3048833 RepID=UPI003F04DA95
MTNIHPTAIIDPAAKIDPSTVVGPYTVIGADVVIGKNNHIGPFCVIENTTMGDGNDIIASAFIGVKPQDLSYKDESTRVTMGNGNKIRECVTIHRSTDLNSPTSIGNNCLLMANAHVAHDCHLGNNIIIANSTGVAGHVIVEDRVVMSGMVGIHQFVRVGTMAMLSGGAMLPLDIPPFCIAQGERARLVGLNIVGMRRAGLSRETIMEIKRAYKTLFRSGKRLLEACEELEAKKPCAEVQHMIDFCKASKRGVAPAKRKMNEHDDE